MPAFDDDQTHESAPPSIRDSLMASVDAIETGGATAPDAAPLAQDDGTAAAARARDEAGRFAARQEQAPAPAPDQAQQQEQAASAPRPALTTWKRDYLPLQQKLADGIPLKPEESRKLAQYNVEREGQYSTGVSTYRAEAQNAQRLTHAVSEFMPELQKHNIDPAQWIQNLGRAHHTLAMGSPEQKMQMFAKLAQDYGIPLPAVSQQQQGQLDPTVAALMAEISHLKQGVNHFTTWQQQQQDQQVMQEIAIFDDTTKFPHFQQVRESMIQLLESGTAQTPVKAYEMAVRLDDDLFNDMQTRQAQASTVQAQASKAAAIAKAKQSAGQVRTAAPSGLVSAVPAQKDRRATIEAAMEQLDSGRV